MRRSNSCARGGGVGGGVRLRESGAGGRFQPCALFGAPQGSGEQQPEGWYLTSMKLPQYKDRDVMTGGGSAEHVVTDFHVHRFSPLRGAL